MNREYEKKVVITGAGGFLGSSLVNLLADKNGYLVYALSSKDGQLQQRNIKKHVRYCHKDVIFGNEGRDILKDAIIVNCAFPRNSSGIELASGLQYIQKLFNKSHECESRAIINISSQSVYSQLREEAATEKTLVCLENTYAVGKYATELMVESVCEIAKIPYTNLRMASLIGPGFEQRIVNRLIKKAINGETLKIVKCGQKFGFLDIQDAVTAIFAVLEMDLEQWKPVYNIGNGKAYSIEYIVEQIKVVLEKNGLPIPNTRVEIGEKFGSTEVTYNMFFEDTGYVPNVNLDTSIQNILHYIQVQKR